MGFKTLYLGVLAKLNALNPPMVELLPAPVVVAWLVDNGVEAPATTAWLVLESGVLGAPLA